MYAVQQPQPGTKQTASDKLRGVTAPSATDRWLISRQGKQSRRVRRIRLGQASQAETTIPVRRARNISRPATARPPQDSRGRRRQQRPQSSRPLLSHRRVPSRRHVPLDNTDPVTQAALDRVQQRAHSAAEVQIRRNQSRWLDLEQEEEMQRRREVEAFHRAVVTPSQTLRAIPHDAESRRVLEEAASKQTFRIRRSIADTARARQEAPFQADWLTVNSLMQVEREAHAAALAERDDILKQQHVIETERDAAADARRNGRLQRVAARQKSAVAVAHADTVRGVGPDEEEDDGSALIRDIDDDEETHHCATRIELTSFGEHAAMAAEFSEFMRQQVTDSYADTTSVEKKAPLPMAPGTFLPVNVTVADLHGLAQKLAESPAVGKDGADWRRLHFSNLVLELERRELQTSRARLQSARANIDASRRKLREAKRDGAIAGNEQARAARSAHRAAAALERAADATRREAEAERRRFAAERARHPALHLVHSEVEAQKRWVAEERQRLAEDREELRGQRMELQDLVAVESRKREERLAKEEEARTKRRADDAIARAEHEALLDRARKAAAKAAHDRVEAERLMVEASEQSAEATRQRTRAGEAASMMQKERVMLAEERKAMATEKKRLEDIRAECCTFESQKLELEQEAQHLAEERLQLQATSAMVESIQEAAKAMKMDVEAMREEHAMKHARSLEEMGKAQVSIGRQQQALQNTRVTNAKEAARLKSEADALVALEKKSEARLKELQVTEHRALRVSDELKNARKEMRALRARMDEEKIEVSRAGEVLEANAARIDAESKTIAADSEKLHAAWNKVVITRTRLEEEHALRLEEYADGEAGLKRDQAALEQRVLQVSYAEESVRKQQAWLAQAKQALEERQFQVEEVMAAERAAMQAAREEWDVEREAQIDQAQLQQSRAYQDQKKLVAQHLESQRQLLAERDAYVAEIEALNTARDAMQEHMNTMQRAIDDERAAVRREADVEADRVKHAKRDRQLAMADVVAAREALEMDKKAWEKDLSDARAALLREKRVHTEECAAARRVVEEAQRTLSAERADFAELQASMRPELDIREKKLDLREAEVERVAARAAEANSAANEATKRVAVERNEFKKREEQWKEKLREMRAEAALARSAIAAERVEFEREVERWRQERDIRAQGIAQETVSRAVKEGERVLEIERAVFERDRAKERVELAMELNQLHTDIQQGREKIAFDKAQWAMERNREQEALSDTRASLERRQQELATNMVLADEKEAALRQALHKAQQEVDAHRASLAASRDVSADLRSRLKQAEVAEQVRLSTMRETHDSSLKMEKEAFRDREEGLEMEVRAMRDRLTADAANREQQMRIEHDVDIAALKSAHKEELANVTNEVNDTMERAVAEANAKAAEADATRAQLAQKVSILERAAAFRAERSAGEVAMKPVVSPVSETKYQQQFELDSLVASLPSDSESRLSAFSRVEDIDAEPSVAVMSSKRETEPSNDQVMLPAVSGDDDEGEQEDQMEPKIPPKQDVDTPSEAPKESVASDPNEQAVVVPPEVLDESLQLDDDVEELDLQLETVGHAPRTESPIPSGVAALTHEALARGDGIVSSLADLARAARKKKRKKKKKKKA